MPWSDWFRGDRRPRFDGTTGRPTSSNGASSFHLFWEVGGGPWTAAEAVLEVVDPPTVPELHFWALQVSFTGGGRSGGGAHLGLQWFPIHPGSTAVNWGGYGAGGGELAGSTSALPSTPGNANTRDLPWRPGRPYRLRVEAAPPDGQAAAPAGTTAWRGSVTDLTDGTTTVVRDLYAAGTRLDGPMVWSEVFAPCDAPSSAVRWSGLVLEAADGARTEVAHVRVNYQSVPEGGCTTTDVRADGPGAFAQVTGTTRRTTTGTRLP